MTAKNITKAKTWILFHGYCGVVSSNKGMQTLLHKLLRKTLFLTGKWRQKTYGTALMFCSIANPIKQMR